MKKIKIISMLALLALVSCGGSNGDDDGKTLPPSVDYKKEALNLTTEGFYKNGVATENFSIDTHQYIKDEKGADVTYSLKANSGSQWHSLQFTTGIPAISTVADCKVNGMVKQVELLKKSDTKLWVWIGGANNELYIIETLK